MLAAAMAILGGVSADVVVAQSRADPSEGHALAERLCAACHVVDTKHAGSSRLADVPSFAAIANRSGQTAEAIAGRILMPHPQMPTVQLTRTEIADLATYIMSLRQP
jgi:mono/diheme cytochrome c family protein